MHLQQSLSSNDTLAAKRAFETFGTKHNVIIKHYHADDGRFADNAFLQDVQEQKQSISFCAVNAHFQNGIAEKKIRDLSEMARKQLFHAKARWSSAIHLCLWPFALRNAAYIQNNMPSIHNNGLSSIEIFSQATVSPNMKRHHTFGCPVFALDNSLQSGKSLPRWNARSRVGVNLGHSPRHSSSVSLVLNTTTGLVSPQFHVSFDEHFDSTRNAQSHPNNKYNKWQILAGFRDINIPSTVSPSHSPPDPLNLVLQREQTREVGNDATENNFLLPIPDQDPPPPPDAISREVIREEIVHTAGPHLPSISTPSHTTSRGSSRGKHSVRGSPRRRPTLSNNDPPTTPTPEPTSISRYGRIRKMTDRMRAYKQQAYSAILAIFEDEPSESELVDPIALVATSNPDTMYFDQAMQEEDSEQFLQAVVKEMNDHISRKHWQLIPRSSVPRGVKVLPSVWSMKRKRDIQTNKVYKWKARLNVHGGRQTYGVNYWETFSPVVTWITIRIVFLLIIINNWHSRQVDFVLAFPQADIEVDMYMEIPK